MKVTALAAALALAITPVAAPAAAAAEAPSGKSTVIFVVDTSGSMSGSRITQAKQALQAGVDALAQGQPAGLRSYSGGCGYGGRLLVEPSGDNREALRGAINGLYASGGTPTPDALRAAATDFPAGAENKLVILISDGQSTCGDPCPVARQLSADTNTAFRAHTVGFNAPEAAEGELACIADATGGNYYTATDAEGLGRAISDALSGTAPEYVAVGDSTTTGFSIPDCDGDKIRARNGCTGEPTATPYPERIAASGSSDYDDLSRVGIWGDTFKGIVESYDRGNNGGGSPWEPQLREAEKATDLVTVSLGANDMEWSKIDQYLAACVGARTREVWGKTVPTGGVEVKEDSCLEHVNKKTDALRPNMVRAFDVLETPRDAGASVAVALYYNPLNASRHLPFRPDRDCALLHNIGRIVVGRLNVALKTQADARGFKVADLGPAFAGHGSGAKDPYVFGSDCEPRGLLTVARFDIDLRERRVSLDKERSIAEAAKRFDPHPNSAGTKAQSETVLEALK